MIEYTIDENKVDSYTTEIEGDMENGFTVINTILGEGGNDNPYTFDAIYSYIIMLVVSLVGLIKLSYIYIKHN